MPYIKTGDILPYWKDLVEKYTESSIDEHKDLANIWTANDLYCEDLHSADPNIALSRSYVAYETTEAPTNQEDLSFNDPSTGFGDTTVIEETPTAASTTNQPSPSSNQLCLWLQWKPLIL